MNVGSLSLKNGNTAKITILGGGAGLSEMLRALKKIRGVKITAICTSADDGTCTGVMRKDYKQSGYIGDLMRCILALSSTPDDAFVRAMEYRFLGGKYDGLVERNALFVSVLETLRGSDLELSLADTEKKKTEAEERVLQQTLDVLYHQFGLGVHRVVPVIAEPVDLHVLRKDGTVVRGESNVTNFCRVSSNPEERQQIAEIVLVPSQARVYPPARRAIIDADLVMIAPGSFFTSIMPVLHPQAIKDLIKEGMKGQLLLIFPLLIHPEEIGGYYAEDLLEQIEKQVVRRCDWLLCNNDFADKGDPERGPDRVEKKKMVNFRTPELSLDPRLHRRRLRTGPESGLHDPELTARALRDLIDMALSRRQEREIEPAHI